MLSKLLKYEYKATARIFVPLYIALLVFSIINRFFLSYETNNVFLSIPLVIGKLSYAMLIIAIVVLSLVIMIQRYYKNLLSEEGYLMFTLPVRSRDHIISKLVVSFTWNIATIVLVIGSLMILLVTPENLVMIKEALTQAWNEIQPVFGSNVFLIGLELAALMIVGFICSILMIYTAISIGQLVTKHKLLGSFGAYIGLNFITQTVSSIMVAIAGFASPGIFDSATPPIWFIHAILLGSAVMSVVFCVGYFIVTNYILTRKLNLE